jgi:hypothetical protein
MVTLAVFLCTVADDFGYESRIGHVVDVLVDNFGHRGLWVEGCEMIILDVFIVSEIGVGVSTSCS